MLSMRPPLACAARTDYIQLNEGFSRRIAGNYGQMQERIEGEDLLHVVTQPPEIFLLGDSGNSFLSETEVKNQQIQKVSILNQAINRILLAVDGHLTYQDQVYITNILNKLGITDIESFMQQVYRLTEETRQVNRLLHAYEDHNTVLMSLMEEYRSENIRREGDVENRLTREILHLHEEVFKRWDARNTYDSLRAYATSLEGGTVINSVSYQMAEQTRLSQQLTLQAFREKLRGEDVPLVYHHENIFEGEELEPAQVNIQSLTNRIASAVLLSLVDNLYQSGYSNVDHRKEQYYQFDEVFYRAGDHVLSRMATNTAYRQHNYETAITDNSRIEQYQKEYLLLRQMISAENGTPIQIAEGDTEFSFSGTQMSLVQEGGTELSGEERFSIQNQYLQQLYELEQQNLQRRQEYVTRLEQLVRSQPEGRVLSAVAGTRLVREPKEAAGEAYTETHEGDTYEQQLYVLEQQNLEWQEAYITKLEELLQNSSETHTSYTKEELAVFRRALMEQDTRSEYREKESYRSQTERLLRQNAIRRETYITRLEELLQNRDETHPVYTKEELTVLRQEYMAETAVTENKEGEPYRQQIEAVLQQDNLRQEAYITRLEELLQSQDETHLTYTKEELAVLRQELTEESKLTEYREKESYRQQTESLLRENAILREAYITRLEELLQNTDEAHPVYTREELSLLRQELTAETALTEYREGASYHQQSEAVLLQNGLRQEAYITRLEQLLQNRDERQLTYTKEELAFLRQELTESEDLTEYREGDTQLQTETTLQQKHLRRELYITRLEELLQNRSETHPVYTREELHSLRQELMAETALTVYREGDTYRQQLEEILQQSILHRESYIAKLEELLLSVDETHPSYTEEELLLLRQDYYEEAASFDVEEGDRYESWLLEQGSPVISQQEAYISRLEVLLQNRNESFPTYTREELTFLRQTIFEEEIFPEEGEGKVYEVQPAEAERRELRSREAYITRLEELLQDHSMTDHVFTREELTLLRRETEQAGKPAAGLREGDAYTSLSETQYQESLRAQATYITRLEALILNRNEAHPVYTKDELVLLHQEAQGGDTVTELFEDHSSESQSLELWQVNRQGQEAYITKLESLLQQAPKDRQAASLTKGDLILLRHEVEGDVFSELHEGDRVRIQIEELRQQNLNRQTEYVSRLEKLLQTRGETLPSNNREELTLLHQEQTEHATLTEFYQRDHFVQQLQTLEQQNLYRQAEYFLRLEQLNRLYEGAIASYTDVDVTQLHQEGAAEENIIHIDQNRSFVQEIEELRQQSSRILREYATSLSLGTSVIKEPRPVFTEADVTLLHQEIAEGDTITHVDERNSLEQQIYELEQRNLRRQEEYLTNLSTLVQEYEAGREVPTDRVQREASLAALEHPQRYLEVFEQEAQEEKVRRAEFSERREALLPRSTREILSLVRTYISQPERFADENLITVNNEAQLYYDSHIAGLTEVREERTEQLLETETEGPVTEEAGGRTEVSGSGSEVFAQLVYAPVAGYSTDSELRLPEALLQELRAYPVMELSGLTRDSVRLRTQIIQKLLYADPSILNSERGETVYEALSFAHRTEGTIVDEETIAQLREQITRMESTTEATKNEVENRIEEMGRTIRNTTRQTITTDNQSEITQRVGQTTRMQIDEIADKVYSRLERQLNNERMRRGLR